MTLQDIASARLLNQQLAGSSLKTAVALLEHMGAMQAQDFTMSKWALGIRLNNLTEVSIENAFNKGLLLRTHVMRPTWHLVPAKDICWMLDLTAARIKASMNSRHRELGLTEKLFTKGNDIIRDVLDEKVYASREVLVEALRKAKIATNENRSIHLLLYAELEGLICSGPTKNKKQTYALLEKRVPKPKKLSRDEALKMLAKRYFASHGPATLQDFMWWSGLSAAEARQGLEMIKSKLHSKTVNKQEYWFESLPRTSNKQQVHLLPAYDEFIISYKDRSASVDALHSSKSISSNGIFRPVIMLNGKAVGLWKRTIKKNKPVIETVFFDAKTKISSDLLNEAAKKYAAFLDLEEAEVRKV